MRAATRGLSSLAGEGVAYSFFKRLPKAELHLHLDGSVKAVTLLELYKEQNIPLPYSTTTKFPTVEEFTPLIVPSLSTTSLKDFLRAFEYTLPPLQTLPALKRSLWEIARDCIPENIKYVEVRFSPELHTQKGLTNEQVLDCVLETSREINKSRKQNDKLPIVKVICIAVRNLGDEHVTRMAQLTKQFYELESKQESRELVAFDIAGSEAEFPTHLFEKQLKLVNDAGVPITVHSGEAGGPENVRSAVNSGAKRIGHGVALQHDQELMNIVKEKDVAIEICLTSNQITKACPNLSEHPLKLFCSKNIACVPCTDSFVVIPTTLTNEYLVAHQLGLISEKDAARLSLNGFKYSFLSDKEKAPLVAQVEEEIEQCIKALKQ